MTTQEAGRDFDCCLNGQHDKRLEDVVFHFNGDGQYPYQVCNALLDAETNEHCEWDGRISPSMMEGFTLWVCPACGRRRPLTQEAGS